MLGRARGRRPRRRRLPPADPRRLQGAALPRRRLGHPRRRHQPDAGHGRPAQGDAGHLRDDDHRPRRARRPAAVRRLLLQGGRARRGRGIGAPRRSGRVLGRLARAGRRPGDRRCHRRVRHPALADDLLRRRPQRPSPVHESAGGDDAGRWSCSPSRRRCSASSGFARWLPDVAGDSRATVRRCTWGWSRPCSQSLLAAVGFAAVLVVVAAGAGGRPAAARRACARCSSTRSTSTPSTTGCSSGRSGSPRVRCAGPTTRSSSARCAGSGQGATRLAVLLRRTQQRQRADLPHRPARRRRAPGRRGR